MTGVSDAYAVLSAPWRVQILLCFFFNDTATTGIYTLSLHDALPILGSFSNKQDAIRHGEELRSHKNIKGAFVVTFRNEIGRAHV